MFKKRKKQLLLLLEFRAKVQVIKMKHLYQLFKSDFRFYLFLRAAKSRPQFLIKVSLSPPLNERSYTTALYKARVFNISTTKRARDRPNIAAITSHTQSHPPPPIV